MTTYYVSQQNGNASYDGTAPVHGSGNVGPKLTITGMNAADVLVGDDIVYIGPGTYREGVTLTDSGTDGHPIKWMADPECVHLTGDKPGVVRWTSTDVNDKSQALAASRCLDYGTTVYVEIYGPMILDGSISATSPTVRRGNSNLTGKLFDCLIFGGSIAVVGVYAARCVAIGPIAFSEGKTECCIAIGGVGFLYPGDGSNGCVAIGSRYGFQSIAAASTLYNLLAIGCTVGFQSADTTDPYTPTLDHCHAAWCGSGFRAFNKVDCSYSGCAIAVVDDGYGSGTPTETAVMLIPALDLLKRALEPGMCIAGLYNQGNDSYPPSVTDILNRTRQLGAVDIGAYELASVELGWTSDDYDTTPPGIKITGIGEQVIQISAKASTLITVALRAKHKTSVTTKPKITLRGKSIANQTATHTGANDVFETLTVSATPTVNEVLELVLSGQEAAKYAHFSDIQVT